MNTQHCPGYLPLYISSPLPLPTLPLLFNSAHYSCFFRLLFFCNLIQLCFIFSHLAAMPQLPVHTHFVSGPINKGATGDVVVSHAFSFIMHRVHTPHILARTLLGEFIYQYTSNTTSPKTIFHILKLNPLYFHHTHSVI